MYLIYTTDFLHSYASREFQGVFDSKERVIKAIKKNSKIITGAKLSKDDLFNLQNIDQTQGHEGAYEWVIEEVELNKLV
jgi:hypothetical protein